VSTPYHPAERYSDLDPIRLRDPLAVALGVLSEDERFEYSYADVVRAAGHSCPTAAGAFRMAQLGLSALYPDADDVPVRGDVSVRIGGPPGETAFGVTGRLLSLITGAAGEDGFGGLPGGFGRRRGLLRYDPMATDGVAVRLARGATTECESGDDDGGPNDEVVPRVQVTYDVASVPGLGEARRHLPAVVDGSADDGAATVFLEAWHRRVDEVLQSDDYFTVEPADELA